MEVPANVIIPEAIEGPPIIYAMHQWLHPDGGISIGTGHGRAMGDMLKNGKPWA